MAVESFDDFDDEETHPRGIKPFALREDKTEEGTLEWLEKNFDHVKQSSLQRLESYRRWRDLYKGIHWKSTTRNRARSRSQGDYTTSDTNRKPNMVDNQVYELISTRVSQMAKYGANFTCIPWNNEISDIINAQSCDTLLRSRNDELDMENIMSEADEMKLIYGTNIGLVTWDKEEGGEHPSFKKLSEIYKKEAKGIPKKTLKLLNDEGQHFRGDVKVTNFSPYNVFPEPGKNSWDTVNHIDIEEWVNIWEVRADYPKKADDVQEGANEFWDSETGELSMPEDMVLVRHFWHKKTKHLPNGLYIKWTSGAILEMTDFPYEHGKLPIIVDRDIIIDGELWGRSPITNIEQMQRQYNNIEAGVARDLGLGGAPKWITPKGAVEWRSLGNEFTVAEFKGPIAPKLVPGNPVSQHAVAKQDSLRDRMGKLMKVYDISRGNIPTGITANSALRFLDEQESQANARDEKKRKRRIKDTYMMELNLMAQFYQAEDERFVRKLGKNNEYMIENMKDADFSQVADIQMQNTSALPDTKSGKIAAITDLNIATQADPIFRREEVIQMLDLGIDDKFTQEAAYPVEAARMIFEQMVSGKEVAPPAMHDDLMVYYPAMFRQLQSISFKTRVPAEIQQVVFSYIKTMEGLLFLKARKNPKLAMELATLNYYPAFFDVGDLATEPTPLIEGETAEMESDKMNNTAKVTSNAIEEDVNNQTNLV